MILEQDFEDFVKLLNKFGVEYMVVGGYAMALHGKPRFTGDLDIWINISEVNAEKLIDVINAFGLGSLGFEKRDFLQPGYITQIGYPPLRIDILNNIDGIEFSDAILNRQKIIIEHDLEVSFIGLQDLLQNKIASGRKQDLKDVKEIRKELPKKKIASKQKRGNRP
ncbi:MAG: nucleotidyltransferase [Candidatus Pedobacter colombiensis]|uniref:Nucleotidyltransferase n=1 Tax=Candidatus Pedobacter colombiensis TaxID=3121371 RepID=A0AAJ5W7Z2_9SPHI|nr:nucleotidyltransferase [Pedobacter sp.]WEK18866.1 MAG: nucleotidyltransferase [Pedobacter sp.]